jgi:hypothetical protein
MPPVFEGHGRALSPSDFLVETSGASDTALVYLPAGATAVSKIAVPKGARVDAMTPTKSGRFGVMTYVENADGGEIWRGAAFELASGKRTPDAGPMPSLLISAPQASLHGDMQFAIVGDEILCAISRPDPSCVAVASAARATRRRSTARATSSSRRPATSSC